MVWPMRLFLRRSRTEARSLHRAAARVPLAIRLLAAFQGLKGVVFLGAALGAARVARVPDLQDLLMRLVDRFHFDPDSARIHQVLEWSMGLSHDRLRLVAAGLFAYAAIFLVEGIGLWYDRPWAEWLVVLASGLFIPLELQHLVHGWSSGTALMLAINIVVVALLARRIARRRAAVTAP